MFTSGSVTEIRSDVMKVRGILLEKATKTDNSNEASLWSWMPKQCQGKFNESERHIVRPALRDWASQTERCHTLPNKTSLQ